MCCLAAARASCLQCLCGTLRPSVNPTHTCRPCFTIAIAQSTAVVCVPAAHVTIKHLYQQQQLQLGRMLFTETYRAPEAHRCLCAVVFWLSTAVLGLHIGPDPAVDTWLKGINCSGATTVAPAAPSAAATRGLWFSLFPLSLHIHTHGQGNP